MHPGTTWWTATKVVLRSAFLRIWSAVLVHAEGGQRWFQPLMKAQILIISSRTEAKVPRRAVLAQKLERPESTVEELDEYYGPSYAEKLYAPPA